MTKTQRSLLLAAFTCALSATAQYQWDGDNAFGNFTYNDNWYGNTQPAWGFGSNLLFQYNNGSATSLYWDYGAWKQASDILFQSTFDDTYSGTITWNGDGNGLDFNQRLENYSGQTVVIGSMNLSGAKNGATQIELNPVNGNLTLNGSIYNDNSKPYNIYGNNGKTLTINTTLGVGATPGNVYLNVEQNSTVVVNNSQSYAGGTNIRAGILEISNTNALGSFSGGSGYLGIANTGTLRYTGTGSQSDGRYLWIDTGTQTKTIEVTSATGSLNFTSTGGQITQPLNKTGSGALILADTVTSRNLTVSGGTLTTGGITMAQSGGQTLTVASGAGLTSSSFAASWPVTIAVNGTGTWAAGNISLSTGSTSTISGAGSITTSNLTVFNFMTLNYGASGTALTASSNVNFNGVATINMTGGTLSANRLVTSDNSGATSVFNQSAGTVNITGSNATNTTSASFLLSHWNAASTYNLSGGVLNAPNAPLSLGWDGTARLIQTAGTANLQGINFNNGRNNGATYQLTSGRLNIGTYGLNGNASSKWLELNGGTLGAYANWTGGQQINVSATSTIDTLDSVNGVTARTIILNGNMSGTGGLTKAGAGTLQLGGSNNTYSGATLLSAGTMRLNSGAGLGSSSYTASPGTTLELNGTNIFVGGHGVAVGNSRVITINNATLLMTGNADTRLGNIVLNNGSTWTSNRGLTAYDVLLANTDSGAASVSVTGTGASVMDGTGGIHLQGVQNFNVADVTSSSATDLTVSMKLDNNGFSGGAAGGINKTGLGTMLMSAANTYPGTTRVTDGLLIAQGGSAIGDLSTVEMANSSTASLQITSSEQVGSLAGGGASGGNISLGTGTQLTIGNNGNSDTYAGVISGPGASLLKVGGGNQTLSGNNTFTGGVTIANGTITVPFVAASGTPQPLGTAGSAVTFTGAGSLAVTGSGTLDRGLVLANAANGVDAGGTLTQTGAITGGGTSATFTKSGAGTFNQSGAGSWNSNVNVTAGTYNVTSTGSISGVGVVTLTGGSTMNVGTSTQVRASSFNVSSGTLNLNAGTLRTNGITVAGGSAFTWGAATLTMQTGGSGNSGSTDRSGDNGVGGAASGPTVYEGTVVTIDNGVGNTVATSNGSVLDLGGLYGGTLLRYDQLRVTGTLNLAANDTLNVNINPYLLRPSSPNDVAIGDWGTLVLVHAETISGQFNTITGISSDAIGWTQLPTESNSGRLPSTLGLNEWVLEYRTGYGPMAGGDALLLHYRVAGSVPEPASAGLLVAGALMLRALRRPKRS